MMRCRISGVAILAGLLSLVGGFDAAAWGPRAQQTIAMNAMQIIRQTYQEAFGSGGKRFEQDVLRGAQAGAAAMREWQPLNDVNQAMSALDHEIQLLREARKLGIDAYFSYRMGILSSLAADLSMPVALYFNETEEALAKQASKDMDERVERYVVHPRGDRRFIRSAREYFAEPRRNFPDMALLIRTDYSRGDGYDGILRRGGEQYFAQAVEAAADAWYTVMRGEAQATDIKPSPEAMTWYLVRKVEYALNVKKNVSEAERAYKEFRDVNPGVMDAYERVGDYFYEYSEDTQERGVREWERALEYSGSARKRIVEKLGNHYLNVGKNHLAVADAKVKERDKALPNAVQAFTDTLRYDRTNQEAADLLSATNTKIREREARRQTAISLMASAESVMEKAAQSQQAADFAGAVATFSRAQSLFESVDPEFPDQEEAAKARIADIKKGMNKINQDVLDKANQTIGEGDKAVEAKRFDEAIDLYKKVESIVLSIPADEKSSFGRESKELIAKAQDKVSKAEVEKKRAEEQAKQAEAAPLAPKARPGAAK